MTTNDAQEAQARQNSDDYRPSDRWAPAAPVPGVGEVVLFRPRPGEGKSGRIRFPAFVLHIDEGNAHATLLVFFEYDDIRTIPMVPPWSEQNPRGYEAVGDRPAVTPEPQRALLDRLTQTEHEVRSLTTKIMGEGKVALDIPLMEVFAEFHRSIQSLKGQVETLQQRLDKAEKPAARSKGKAPPKRK